MAKKGRVESVTGQELKGMTNTELRKYINKGRQIIERRLKGTETTQGAIDYLLDELNKSIYFPVPKSLSNFFSYEDVKKIEKGEMSKEEAFTNLKKAEKVIPNRYLLQPEEQGNFKGTHSLLVSKARKLRDFLKTQTTIERIESQFTDFRSALRRANMYFENLGLNLKIKIPNNNQMRRIFDVLARVKEENTEIFEDSLYKRRYEVYREIINMTTSSKYKEWSLEEIANEINHKVSTNSLNKEDIRVGEEFDLGGN